jgi:sugar phosphate isomerase/epimerase
MNYDPDFPPLGDGDLDLPALLDRVLETGDEGPLCLEIEFDGTCPDFDGCVDAVRRSLAFWDAAVGNGVR